MTWVVMIIKHVSPRYIYSPGDSNFGTICLTAGPIHGLTTSYRHAWPPFCVFTRPAWITHLRCCFGMTWSAARFYSPAACQIFRLCPTGCFLYSSVAHSHSIPLNYLRGGGVLEGGLQVLYSDPTTDSNTVAGRAQVVLLVGKGSWSRLPLHSLFTFL